MDCSTITLLFLASLETFIVFQTIIYAPFYIGEKLAITNASLNLSLGIFLGSYPCGLIVGSPFLKSFAVKYGRKKCLLLNSVASIFSLLVLAFAGNLYAYIFGFFLLGALGCTWNNIFGAIHDITHSAAAVSDAARQQLNAPNSLMMTNTHKLLFYFEISHGIGCVIAGFVGVFIVSLDNLASNASQTDLHSISTPFIIGIVFYFFALLMVYLLLDINIDKTQIPISNIPTISNITNYSVGYSSLATTQTLTNKLYYGNGVGAPYTPISSEYSDVDSNAKTSIDGNASGTDETQGLLDTEGVNDVNKTIFEQNDDVTVKTPNEPLLATSPTSQQIPEKVREQSNPLLNDLNQDQSQLSLGINEMSPTKFLSPESESKTFLAYYNLIGNQSQPVIGLNGINNENIGMLENSHDVYNSMFDSISEIINVYVHSRLFLLLWFIAISLFIAIFSFDVLFPVFASISSHNGGMGWNAHYIGVFYVLYSSMWLFCIVYRWWKLSDGFHVTSTYTHDSTRSLSVFSVLLGLVYGVVFPWCINSPNVKHSEWSPESWMLVGLLFALVLGYLSAAIPFHIAQLFRDWRYSSCEELIENIEADTVGNLNDISVSVINGINTTRDELQDNRIKNIAKAELHLKSKMTVHIVLANSIVYARVAVPIIIQLLYVIGLHLNSELIKGHTHSRHEWYQIGNFVFYFLSFLCFAVLAALTMFDSVRKQSLGQELEIQQMQRLIEEVRRERIPMHMPPVVEDEDGLGFWLSVSQRSLLASNTKHKICHCGVLSGCSRVCIKKYDYQTIAGIRSPQSVDPL